MVFKVQNLFNILLILFCVFTIILGNCVISFENYPSSNPQISKKIGSRHINILNDKNILLQNNEIVTASCDVKFERPEYYNHLRELVIKCDGNIYASEGGSFSNRYTNEIFLKCASLKWNLYELSDQFVWCPSNMASYILARPINDLTSYTNLAGICYDIEHMSPALFYYTVGPRSMSDLYPAALGKYYFTPREEIKYVKDTFGTKSITSDMYDNQQFKDWIQFANYQYNSTCQNSFLRNKDFSEIGGLLDFVWWPNLRLGNWKRYEDALEKHIEDQNKAYDILAGISDIVLAPVKESCQNNYTMRELVDNTNRKIPMYVWNYLQPAIAHNSSDEVVVIALNSPFYEFYSEKDIVFCQDICSEIDWLKNVRTTFRHSTMGIMFCCSVEEVKSSKRLSGFPEKLYEPLSETITALPPSRLLLPFAYNAPSVERDDNISDIINDY